MSQSNLQSRLFQCAAYLEQYSDQAITLTALARRFAISPYHLQRQFSEVFGLSPKQFQLAVRLNRFKQHLKQGEDVTTAIYAAGFSSSSRVYEHIDDNMGMTPATYQQGGSQQNIHFAVRQTVLGNVIMAATERGVCYVHFGEHYGDLLSALHQEFPQASLIASPLSSEPLLDGWISALDSHLRNNTRLPDIPLDLQGTAFQISVWRFLARLKPGQTLSYGELARAIDKPGAHRAVANACAANKLAVLIPCHRVLRGDGALGGYRWGASRKQQLLSQEGQSIEVLA
ncbi:methylated-DNA--[protein]-cysteine S-methyltransferase [Aestuariibacter halophilus]|uniref:Methylated-DNA--[protein]-cysteine S-methyltransferase n=1 Tax=Fluctibacter halophilus TaxID=226011 RepID=A0ABS8G427_9ALTE|nr:methylated-DNA--[protein]-cysteine S-methyltransferase [Aestuariibacter halophilus]MCC2615320.1 methylated-DNA--[protein]-cysteine S-methyltransferase [Aestuariibacter halophilus]